MLTSDEMAVVDANSEALGVPRKQLMESSGNAVARAVRERTAAGDAVALVCGRGNNGGDALVAARFLREREVTVHLLGRPATITTDIARENWTALTRTEIDTRVVTDSRDFELETPALAVDAMLGTGITGVLREPEATVAHTLNDADCPVLSVDTPSGVDADTGTAAGPAVDADAVVTFHDAKPGLADLAADVTVADIGIPAAAETFVASGDLLRLSRSPDSHKGDHGEVLVVGGGPYTGAPALAAQAALRAGADLARVACPDAIASEVQGYAENIIVHDYDGDRLAPVHIDDLLSRAAATDTVVLGPGLGSHDETLAAVESFLADYDGTAVVDADALRAVPEVETGATLVCTPHQGELRAMGGATADDPARRADLVESFATDLGHTLLVTGREDVISDGDRTRRSRAGNAGMTVGGTGDVLAGTVGALACRLRPHEAASVAAYATGRAGELVSETHGPGLTAGDLVAALPRSLDGE